MHMGDIWHSHYYMILGYAHLFRIHDTLSLEIKSHEDFIV
jgi:hypothetical protein